MIDINTKVQFRSNDGQERKGIIAGYENNLYKINCVGAGIWDTYKIWLVSESMINHIDGVHTTGQIFKHGEQ